MQERRSTNPLPRPHRVPHELRPLRAHRRLAGLNQAELAALAGVSQTTIVSIERGHHLPALRTQQKILAVLRLPACYVKEFACEAVHEREAAAPRRQASAWLGDCAATLAQRHAPTLVPTSARVRALAGVPVPA